MKLDPILELTDDEEVVKPVSKTQATISKPATANATDAVTATDKPNSGASRPAAATGSRSTNGSVSASRDGVKSMSALPSTSGNTNGTKAPSWATKSTAVSSNTTTSTSETKAPMFGQALLRKAAPATAAVTTATVTGDSSKSDIGARVDATAVVDAATPTVLSGINDRAGDGHAQETAKTFDDAIENSPKQSSVDTPTSSSTGEKTVSPSEKAPKISIAVSPLGAQTESKYVTAARALAEVALPLATQAGAAIDTEANSRSQALDAASDASRLTGVHKPTTDKIAETRSSAAALRAALPSLAPSVVSSAALEASASAAQPASQTGLAAAVTAALSAVGPGTIQSTELAAAIEDIVRNIGAHRMDNAHATASTASPAKPRSPVYAPMSVSTAASAPLVVGDKTFEGLTREQLIHELIEKHLMLARNADEVARAQKRAEVAESNKVETMRAVIAVVGKQTLLKKVEQYKATSLNEHDADLVASTAAGVEDAKDHSRAIAAVTSSDAADHQNELSLYGLGYNQRFSPYGSPSGAGRRMQGVNSNGSASGMRVPGLAPALIATYGTAVIESDGNRRSSRGVGQSRSPPTKRGVSASASTPRYTRGKSPIRPPTSRTRAHEIQASESHYRGSIGSFSGNSSVADSGYTRRTRSRSPTLRDLEFEHNDGRSVLELTVATSPKSLAQPLEQGGRKHRLDLIVKAAARAVSASSSAVLLTHSPTLPMQSPARGGAGKEAMLVAAATETPQWLVGQSLNSSTVRGSRTGAPLRYAQLADFQASSAAGVSPRQQQGTGAPAVTQVVSAMTPSVAEPTPSATAGATSAVLFAAPAVPASVPAAAAVLAAHVGPAQSAPAPTGITDQTIPLIAEAVAIAIRKVFETEKLGQSLAIREQPSASRLTPGDHSSTAESDTVSNAVSGQSTPTASVSAAEREENAVRLLRQSAVDDPATLLAALQSLPAEDREHLQGILGVLRDPPARRGSIVVPEEKSVRFVSTSNSASPQQDGGSKPGSILVRKQGGRYVSRRVQEEMAALDAEIQSEQLYLHEAPTTRQYLSQPTSARMRQRSASPRRVGTGAVDTADIEYTLRMVDNVAYETKSALQYQPITTPNASHQSQSHGSYDESRRSAVVRSPAAVSFLSTSQNFNHSRSQTAIRQRDDRSSLISGLTSLPQRDPVLVFSASRASTAATPHAAGGGSGDVGFMQSVGTPRFDKTATATTPHLDTTQRYRQVAMRAAQSDADGRFRRA
jgi:hypothetical protein